MALELQDYLLFVVFHLSRSLQCLDRGFSSEASGIWRSGSIAVPGASHRAGSSSPFHRSAALLFPAEDNLGTGFLHPARQAAQGGWGQPPNVLPGAGLALEGIRACYAQAKKRWPRGWGDQAAKTHHVKAHLDSGSKGLHQGCSWVSAAPCHGHGAERPPAAEDILASY